MSRTYRKSQVTHYWPNLEAYEHKELEYARRQVSMWQAAQVDYGYSEWRAERIDLYNEDIGAGVKRAQDWFSYFRDGKDAWWGFNKKSFRERCNQDIRTMNKVLEKKLVKDPELFEDTIMPGKHSVNHYRWLYD